MARAQFLQQLFLDALPFEPTSCQRDFLSDVAQFITGADCDIMVADGYAGTGKTTAVASVVSSLASVGVKCVLLSPTGRSAKVLSSYAGMEAFTIHKHIYRQKAVGADGFGQFSLSPNKYKNTLFVVDEVSLITVDADSTGRESSAVFGSGNLLEDLVSFVRSGVECRLLLIGDRAQLPPVGLSYSPALNYDYMLSAFGGAVHSSLKTVVRQAKESGILYNATVIRRLISALESGCETVGHLQLDAEHFDDFEVVNGENLIDVLSDAYSRFGEDETVVLTRSNKRAIRYNSGIRSMVQYREQPLEKGERLMVVKNCYQFLEDVSQMSYIANGDIVKLLKISGHEDRYGLHFATAQLSFPDYDDVEIKAKVILDTLDSESPSLTYEQSNRLYLGVNEDYSHIKSKKKRYDAVREDLYFNALQLKYSNAITCHKSQGGQWDCVFIDNPFWQGVLTLDDLKWLYTAITRARKRVCLINYRSLCFPVEL